METTSSESNGHNGHHRHMPEIGEYTAQVANEEIRAWFGAPGSWHGKALFVAGALLVAGIVAFVIRASSDGFDERGPWAYYAAGFAFLLTTVGSAPLVSVALRMSKAHWRRGLSRLSELFAISSIFMLIVYIPLPFMLPVVDDRPSLWINWHGHAPHIYDSMLLVTTVLCGLAILLIGARPDFAALKHETKGIRRWYYSIIGGNWKGTKKEWQRLRAAQGVLGGLYFMMLIFTQLIVSSDYALALIPGWKDSIYPAFYSLTGLQGALAVTLIAMFWVRRTGLQRYISLDQFWGLAKLLLATSLLWFYFWWSGFFVFWYGRSVAEVGVLEYMIKGAYLAPFLGAIAFSFFVPCFFFLIWNPIRKSIRGPAIAATIVMLGIMFSRVREYVAAFSIPKGMVGSTHIEGILGTNTPDAIDILLLLGILGGSAFFYLVALRIFPAVNIWEQREFTLLRKVRPYFKRYAVVLGKPD
ncbi:MAG: hypothetical protein C1O27_000543 [Chloroflexi bacterium]|jgi:molybdopterin-containing oxidoreductase family membrane subunit|nr:MAG: hypothetical protein C1O27_000543 [Chloroflexota bacterium]